MKFRTFHAVLAMALMLAAPAMAQDTKPTNPTPGLLAKVSVVSYTTEERANIDRVFTFLSDTARPRPNWRAENSTTGRASMDGLLKAYGGKPRDAYSQKSFADRTDTIDDIMAKGDRVWVHYETRAKHVGDWFGVKATGKTLTYSAMAMLRFKDGKITHSDFWVDEAAVLEQLGVTIDFPKH